MSIQGCVRSGCRALALFTLLASALMACSRPSEPSAPPQAPPRPMALHFDPSQHVKNALLTEGALPIFHFQCGEELFVRRLVIQT